MNDDERHDERYDDADEGRHARAGDGVPDDEVDAWLRAAPAPAPLDDLRAARIGARARAVFVAAALPSPRARPARGLWSTVVAPGLLVSAVGYYLTWAVSFAAALYR